MCSFPLCARARPRLVREDVYGAMNTYHTDCTMQKLPRLGNNAYVTATARQSLCWSSARCLCSRSVIFAAAAVWLGFFAVSRQAIQPCLPGFGNSLGVCWTYDYVSYTIAPWWSRLTVYAAALYKNHLRSSPLLIFMLLHSRSLLLLYFIYLCLNMWMFPMLVGYNIIILILCARQYPAYTYT